jgi:hypothetical protein
MADSTTTMVRCTTCDTEFSSTDATELANHEGHPLVHIEQA